jgi:hypothetical protein
MTNATELIVTIANAEKRESDVQVRAIVPPGNQPSYSEARLPKSQPYSY